MKDPRSSKGRPSGIFIQEVAIIRRKTFVCSQGRPSGLVMEDLGAFLKKISRFSHESPLVSPGSPSGILQENSHLISNDRPSSFLKKDFLVFAWMISGSKSRLFALLKEEIMVFPGIKSLIIKVKNFWSSKEKVFGN